MASLAQLLASHERILVLDAASGRFQTGLLRAGQPAVWRSNAAEAGKALFQDSTAVLDEFGLRLDEIAAFAYCTGPGSMLGIRTVSMALRTWNTLKPRPVYAFQSLAVAARAEWHCRPRAFAMIADARRDTWHCQVVAADGMLSPLSRVPAAALPEGELLTPAHFRAWATPVRPTSICSYDLSALLPLVLHDDLFLESATPDVFQHEAPEYKKWSAQTHSAESVSRP